jgi:hypothetical protein
LLPAVSTLPSAEVRTARLREAARTCGEQAPDVSRGLVKRGLAGEAGVIDLQQSLLRSKSQAVASGEALSLERRRNDAQCPSGASTTPPTGGSAAVASNLGLHVLARGPKARILHPLRCLAGPYEPQPRARASLVLLSVKIAGQSPYAFREVVPHHRHSLRPAPRSGDVGAVEVQRPVGHVRTERRGKTDVQMI